MLLIDDPLQAWNKLRPESSRRVGYLWIRMTRRTILAAAAASPHSFKGEKRSLSAKHDLFLPEQNDQECVAGMQVRPKASAQNAHQTVV